MDTIINNKIVDVKKGPIDPEQIGGIREGDGDTGKVDPIPPFGKKTTLDSFSQPL